MTPLAARSRASELLFPFPYLSKINAQRASALLLEVWGFEPQTYGLQSHRSDQLSYTPGSRTPEDKTNNRQNAASLLYHRVRMATIHGTCS